MTSHLWLWVSDDLAAEGHRHSLKDLVMLELLIEEWCDLSGSIFIMLNIIVRFLHRWALQTELDLADQTAARNWTLYTPVTQTNTKTLTYDLLLNLLTHSITHFIHSSTHPLITVSYNLFSPVSNSYCSFIWSVSSLLFPFISLCRQKEHLEKSVCWWHITTVIAGLRHSCSKKNTHTHTHTIITTYVDHERNLSILFSCTSSNILPKTHTHAHFLCKHTDNRYLPKDVCGALSTL